MPRERTTDGRARTHIGGREEPRILVVAESLPYPTLKGGDLRTWQNVNALAACAQVGVFGLCSNDRRRDTVPDIDLTCWTTSTDAALASPPPKGLRLPGRAWLFDPQGHPSDLFYSDVAARELADLLTRLAADVVLLEGLWLHRYLPIVQAEGRRAILDCHNIEAALFQELALATHRPDLEGRLVRDVLPARTLAIERRAVHGVDQIWVCSDDDRRRLRELYDPSTPTHVVPNGVRLEDYPERRVRGTSPSPAPLTLVFTGIFTYPPNARAAAFLVDEVLPHLASVCETWRLLLVGPMPTDPLLAAAARDPRITVTGPVPDVRPYLDEATALAAPLFEGGGTRMKIIEAFAAGLPVISTSKGAEGLSAQPGTHLLVAETPVEFVEAALAIWHQPALATRLTVSARALVAERFSWQVTTSSIEGALRALNQERDV